VHLVQLLLPLYDNGGEPLPRSLYAAVRDELTERFGGLTAYTRAPAEGVWQDTTARRTRDDIVIYEVMTDELDTRWWADYRRELEVRFRQDALVARAQEIRLL
jgi:hypothetical protein